MGLPANIGMGIGAGAGIGILGALIKRKMDNDQLALQVPEERASLPMIDRPEPAGKKPKVKKIPMPKDEPEREKTAFTPTVGHAVGATAGAAASYSILNRLFQRKDKRQLDMALQQKEDRLNELLLQEQSLAAGLPKTAVALMKRSAEHMTATLALEKIAGDVYDQMEKVGWDRPIKNVLHRLLRAIGLKDANLLIPAAAAAGGALYGANRVYNADPNTIKAKAVKDSLKERLTGKDQMIGPMPIRVESDAPEMSPIRPGASSLVDPTRGRDVLEGI